MLSVAGHLTDRDRELVRLIARHRVLTTDQLAALAFRNITTARHRLAVLVRLGLLRRFRPHRATGSAPGCAAAWMPLHGGHPPMRLIDLGNVLPDPWRTEREYDELDPAETGWDEVESDRL